MNNIAISDPAGLLDTTTTAVVQSILGPTAPPTREALQALIHANTDLIASGDKQAMARALARQAIALESGMLGLLSVMATSTTPDHRLALAKAAATLHGSCLRALSAIHQIGVGAPSASPV